MASYRDNGFFRNAAFPKSRLRTRDEVEQELARPCGRFRRPATLEQKLGSSIIDRLRFLDPLGEGQLFLVDGTPLNWHALLHYLWHKNVISDPKFSTELTSHDRPKLKNFGLSFNTGSLHTDGQGRTQSGFGGSFEAEDAMSKTVGETLERYFLSKYDRSSLIQGSQNELMRKGYSVLNTRDLNGYMDWQKSAFPEMNTNADTPFYWTWAVQHPKNRRVLVPAQLIFWNYRHTDPRGVREKVLLPSTTSGNAGHFSRTEAILSGLLEHIQRDGFLLFWLNKIAPPVIDVSLLKEPALDELLEYCRRYRFDVSFLNTTTDIRVPSVTCVLRDMAGKESVISIGASSGFNIIENIRHSAVEALIVNNYAARREPYALPKGYAAFRKRGVGREERLRLWRGSEMLNEMSFFLKGPTQNPKTIESACGAGATPEEQLTAVVAELARLGRGYEVYVYEKKDPTLEALGYHVVRTFVPKLIPLYLAEHLAPLDSQRLREVPQKLGYAAAVEFNSWPHPFP